MSRPLPSVVLVTGAAGFVGRHVCAALLERGVQVRALVRPGGAAPPGTTRHEATGLHDVAAIRRALDGCEAVVHLAALVHAGGRDAPRSDAYRRVNVEGTRIVAEQAVAAGARAVVLASTVKVMGEHADAPLTEATAPAPADPYGASKLEAERVLRDLAARHGLHAPILRLPLVYGPGMRANALRLFALVDRGVPLPVGAVRNRRSLLFAGNLAAAVIATLASARGGDTFFVSDGHDVSTPELVRAIARALGRPARLVPVPVPALRSAARVGDLLARVVPWPATTAALDRLTGSLAVDSSRLRERTGFTPPYSMEEGLRITADWYRREGAAG